MSWVKRQLILAAFDELGLSGSVYDLQPSELLDAKSKMDAMISAWGIGNIGYASGDNPDSGDLDQESGLSASISEAVYLNLAVRLAGSYGKQLSQDTRSAAKSSLDKLRARLAEIPVQSFPSGVPLGAGNRRRRFSPPTTTQECNCG
jgi:hypothetical protein